MPALLCRLSKYADWYLRVVEVLALTDHRLLQLLMRLMVLLLHRLPGYLLTSLSITQSVRAVLVFATLNRVEVKVEAS